MATRGMFHALTSARRVLADDGLILDIHPVPRRPVIYHDGGDGRTALGRLRGRQRHYVAADARVARAISKGLLVLEHTEEMAYLHHASSLNVLRAYLKKNWKPAWIDSATERRIRRVLGPRGVGPLVVEEWVRVSLLTKRVQTPRTAGAA